MTLRMRFILPLAVIATASCSRETADSRNERYAAAADRVSVIMADLRNPRWEVSVTDVERPSADWCPASSIEVRTCASAMPKRDLYWLEISCAGKQVYVAEHNRAFPNSLMLVNLNDREICRKKS